MQGSVDPPQQEMQTLIGLLNQGKFEEVLRRTSVLAQRYSRSVVLYNIAGAANGGLLRSAAALARFDKAIQLKPDYADAYINRGNALQDLKRLDEAVASYDRAIQLSPGHVDAHYNRGNALQQLQRLDEAVASYDRAIHLSPGYVDAYHNRGNALWERKRLDEALASYDKAIQLSPGHVDAYYNRGNALRELKRFEEALASYDKAIQLSPGHGNAYYNRGTALYELQRLDEAVASFDKAIQLKPDFAEAYHNRGNALYELQRLDEAIASFDKALQLKPDYAAALSEMMVQKSHICDWTEEKYAADLSRIGVEGDAISPFSMLAEEDNPISHLERAKTWARETYAHPPAVVFGSSAEHRILRIGYFSADFHNHATMYLMASLFGLHDKRKVEIYAFSYDVSAPDEMRQRLLRAVDEFHDVGGVSDQAVAELARSKSIDVAVDLKGYTRHGRSGIFAHRAAPIQINYLGYPGSMGADFIDYIIADKVVIPKSAQEFYSEKVIYLPDSYQVNDSSREISNRQFKRSELGLPDDGFVFCCFNNNYKISPFEFDIWMRLLAEVEGSVFWLLRGNKWAEANLRKEAVARGIDASRIVFAEKMSLPNHLARHRCADLFLDTFNVNAHTTASDALWSGLPVVTKLGEGFPARVAGSLLNAAII
jgi:predicted O-linked N-acetylglucosamine transferase (SPINDLY family)